VTLLARVVAGSGVVLALSGCTETPDYFPPCVDPYTDACPAVDGGAVTDAKSDAPEGSFDP
jgi:hypothetical protein